jgi:cytochrome c oxidase subunit 2
VTIIWILTTIVGEVLLFLFQDNMFPVQGAKEAIIIDEAFFLLSVLGLPIFTLVCSVLIYSLIKFRASKQKYEYIEPNRFHKKWAWSWLTWSLALCLFVVVTPGLTGLRDLRATANHSPDILIRVTGVRWQWSYEYVNQETQETMLRLIRKDDVLVLPNDSLIRFKVTAPENDVLHSFWIPAFRQKIDAVPGLTTGMDVQTIKTGSYEDDVNYRVQCAELCGVGHAPMNTKVRVVEKKEFEKWLSEKKN